MRYVLLFRKLMVLLIFVGCSLHSHADVILHAFNWPYRVAGEKAKEIKALGYKKVMVSPAFKSSGEAWYMRYQPQDYRLIDNPLGNTTDFETMVKRLEVEGLEVYADIVFNHMANESQWRTDLNYPGDSILRLYKQNPSETARLKLFGDINLNIFSKTDFHPKCPITDWGNPENVQNCWMGGLPDLTDNQWVIEQQQTYLRKLKSMGVKGFRIDAAKNMSIAQINRIFSSDIRKNTHIFGEIITTGGSGTMAYDQYMIPFLSQTGLDAYDFPLFSQIRKAFGAAGSMKLLQNPLPYGQSLPKGKEITFVITHDIPNNREFRYQIMNATDEMLAYAYILGRDGGIPLVYTDHNESGDQRWTDAYRNKKLVAMIRFHNAMQGKTSQIMDSSDCYLVFGREGKGVVAINKCDTPATATLQLSEQENGKVYSDVFTGNKLKIDQPDQQIRIPPRSVRMWLTI